MDKHVQKMIMTALMACMITVSTMAFRIPIPFTTEYIHLGDSMIYLSVMILGLRRGAAAAGIGSALADILGGFAVWAPWTLAIKALMALLMGLCIEKHIGGQKRLGGLSLPQLIGMVCAGIWMIAGYYIASGIIYSNFITAAIAVPWNGIQSGVGILIAGSLAVALGKTPARKYFHSI